MPGMTHFQFGLTILASVQWRIRDEYFSADKSIELLEIQHMLPFQFYTAIAFYLYGENLRNLASL